ncbi:MAG: hypothetical protein EXX96DRAFT_472132 [Benjaminiella poitrasii]|nr:MAG: hypothetical protein EXX96DRAFT_472132 [Benjaminiella poitrasii]
MGDIAEQVRIERQRAKRQQRILASAASRLHKITSSQAAIRGGKEETHDTEQTKNSIAEHYPSPADPRRKKYEAELEAHFCDEHRPLVKELVKDRKFDEDEENMLLTGKIPLSLLEDNKHTPKAKASTFEDDFIAYTRKYTNKNDKYWHLLHFVSMVWLGILATYQVVSEHGLNQVRTLFTQGQIMDLNSYYVSMLKYK